MHWARGTHLDIVLAIVVLGVGGCASTESPFTGASGASGGAGQSVGASGSGGNGNGGASSTAVGGASSSASGGASMGGTGGGTACSVAADCPGQDTSCLVRACVQGICELQAVPVTTNCEDGGTCDGFGNCTNKAAGAPCSTGGDCASGNCPADDLVCCDQACTSECYACLASKTGGTDGSCGPTTTGSTFDGDCAAGGACSLGNCVSGGHLWSKRFGDPASEQPQSITTDNAGNVYIGGYFSNTINFGGQNLIATATTSPFLVKLDANGNHVWSKTFQGSMDFHLAIDPMGFLLVAGTLGPNGIALGGPGLSPANGDVAVAKFDSNGTHYWSQNFGGSSGLQSVSDIAVALNGDLIVTGECSSSCDLGGTPSFSSGLTDIFVARYASQTGNHVSSVRYGTSYAEDSEAIAHDSQGNLWLTGRSRGTVDFGGGQLGFQGSVKPFLVKLDANYNHLYSTQFTSCGSGLFQRIAVGPGDEVGLVSEGGGGSCHLGGPTIPSGGTIVVGMFDSTGAHQWSTKLGGSTNDQPRAIALDATGSLIVAGDFADTADFGNGAVTSAGNYDLFLVKFDNVGTVVWSNTFGGTGNDREPRLTTDASNNVLMTGRFENTINFGGPNLTSMGSADVFVAKLAP